ncbi:hypothetical protein JCM11491_005916 [Sporobolomyces phaffii]
MTRPLPTGYDRRRQYKSCAGCRRVKAKCCGVDEAYLKALDDPRYVFPGPARDRPRCQRCTLRDVECDFVPSRRNGRPRRIVVDPGAPSPSRSPTPYDLPPSLSYLPQRDPSPSPSQSPPPPPPPLSRALGAPSLVIRSGSKPPRRPLSVPSSRSNSSVGDPRPAREVAIVGPPLLELIGAAYLSHIFVWNPLLPAEASALGAHLATCDPHLLAAINCTVEPALAPPAAFPAPDSRVSLSALQAAVLFAYSAYGRGGNDDDDDARAIRVAAWATTTVHRLGWNGTDTANLSRAIERREVVAFVECGWTVYALAIFLGALTQKKSRYFQDVHLPKEITPENVYFHALAVLRDATDHKRVRALGSARDRRAYLDRIVERSESIYRAAVGHLDATTPAYDPAPHLDPAALVVAASRESAFVAAVVAPAAAIALLARVGRGQRRGRRRRGTNLFASDFSGEIRLASSSSDDDEEEEEDDPAGRDEDCAAIARAAKQILVVVRTTRNREGHLLAFERHAPGWGIFVVVAAWGTVVGGGSGAREFDSSDGTGGAGTAKLAALGRQVRDDVAFCRLVLDHAHQRAWARTETYRRQVDAIANSAPVLALAAATTEPHKPSKNPASLAALLN